MFDTVVNTISSTIIEVEIVYDIVENNLHLFVSNHQIYIEKICRDEILIVLYNIHV